MSHSPSVAIVLVNWNGLRDTLACLHSLVRVSYDRLSLIVVDNGSRTDEASQIRDSFPDTTVLEAGKNLGFSGGNNLGIRRALEDGADYILCLNNDTTVAPDFLTLMVDAMESDPSAGVATSAIFYQGEPDRLNNLGCTVRLGETEPFGYIRDVPEERLQSGQAVEVPFAEGCVLMMRRAVAEAAGGFDDALFAYHEDADLCLRARAAGWRCVAVPRSHVWHKIHASDAQSGSQTASYYCARNTWHVVRRHGTETQWQTFRRAERDATRARWHWFFLQCVAAEKRPDGRAYLDGLVYGTYGTWSGAKGIRGPRLRWRVLESVFTGLLRMLVVTGLMIRPVAYPFFSALRARGQLTRQ